MRHVFFNKFLRSSLYSFSLCILFLCISYSKVPTSFRDLSLNNNTNSNQNNVKIFWTAQEVQSAIKLLINKDFYQNNIELASYLRIYKVMTHKRDDERIKTNGMLRPKNKFDERLNDALADLMTKNYLRQMFSFMDHNDKISDLMINAELNESLYHNISPLYFLMTEAYTWKQSSTCVALNSTLYYLYYNIAFSISALPHFEAIWTDRPEKNLKERISRVRKYIHDFMKFNTFLTNNISTVLKVLSDNNPSKKIFKLENISSIFEPIIYLTISDIRLKAFHDGLQLASQIKHHSHPYLKQLNWWPSKNFNADFNSCNVNLFKSNKKFQQ